MARPKATESEVESVAEDVQPEPDAIADPDIDPTETFKKLELPYCEDCKQLLQSSYMGHPICPLKKEGCERNL